MLNSPAAVRLKLASFVAPSVELFLRLKPTTWRRETIAAENLNSLTLMVSVRRNSFAILQVGRAC